MSIKLCEYISEKYQDVVDTEAFFSKGEDLLLAYRGRARSKVSGDCNTNLFFGFFFDGTRSNYVKADENESH